MDKEVAMLSFAATVLLDGVSYGIELNALLTRMIDRIKVDWAACLPKYLQDAGSMRITADLMFSSS
jgi:hypothetical protein